MTFTIKVCCPSLSDLLLQGLYPEDPGQVLSSLGSALQCALRGGPVPSLLYLSWCAVTHHGLSMVRCLLLVVRQEPAGPHHSACTVQCIPVGADSTAAPVRGTTATGCWPGRDSHIEHEGGVTTISWSRVHEGRDVGEGIVVIFRMASHTWQACDQH
jgi:hypothetical protein